MILDFTGGVRPIKRASFSEQEIKRPESFSVISLKVSPDATVSAKIGADVKRGTLLGISDETPVYSSVAGKFNGMTEADGESYFTVEYKSESAEEILCPPETRDILGLTRENIIDIAKKFAVVDTRSGLPLWKLLSSCGKFRRVVIDCTETDALGASNIRICVEKTKSVVGGAKVLMQATGALKCVFAAEYNRVAIFESLSELATDKKLFAMAELEEKYPYGDRALMSALYLRSLRNGETSLDKGVLTVSAETACALYDCMVSGMPHLDRYISVSGIDGEAGENLCVPRGTALSDLTAICDFIPEDCEIIENSLLSGGPAGDIIGDTTRVLICMREEEPKKRTYCISCGKCVNACPVRLFPFEAVSGRNKKLRNVCISCGACEFICPSGIPLVSLIWNERKTKEEPQKEEE